MANLLVKSTKIIFVILILVVVTIYFYLRQSLPILEGQVQADVEQTVIVSRDEQGIAQINGSNRRDVSVALGYLHAQERFFQMDLLRRNSAGELSELFGELALKHDKKIRVHQFRKRVTQFVSLLTEEQQSILQSYTAGVNQGLEDLAANPFEYALLSATPKPWLPEDSMLVLYSMYMDLQYEYGDRELLLGAMSDLLSEEGFQFLIPEGSNWDAAVDGTQLPKGEMPAGKVFADDLSAANALNLANAETINHAQQFELFPDNQEGFKGSNNWAVSGNVSKTGSAIVADDMHLGIAVPNIWYRTSLRYTANDQPLLIDGVSLPGTPAIVVGSNHNIAWGFTNSYGDWNDLIKLVVSEDGTQYLTPEGYKSFILEQEAIDIKGQQAKSVTIKLTQWGPVIGEDHQGNLLAMRWVAHDAEGVNFNLFGLEYAQNVEQAIEAAHSAGIPAQNLMVGDRYGSIAWTIAGAIPRKFGLDNTGSQGWAVPQDWSTGDIGWSGYLNSDEYPVVLNPEKNRLWTGNSRVVGDDMYQKLGNGGYALGARSQQIRDGLMAIEEFTEQDLLDIQNDDKAVFLTPWHRYLLDTVLTDEFVKEHDYAQLVEQLNQWQARASVDSVGYLFVRQFRLNLRDELFSPLTKMMQEASKDNALDLSFRPIRSQVEIPMWQLLTQQPQHLLPEGHASWNEFSQSVASATYQELVEKYGSIDKATWGAHNTTNIQHPLSKAIPALGWLLDMPQEPVRGDTFMPRVQGVAFGSSQRMVVSPGHEHQAIFHMPSSQSGHPLSPFYGKGHDDWVKGVASPLLPGVTKYTLEFTPK
ncbi:penicillin acylase family protein [Thalassotalea litorea]|uniref:Penicillin acylase family protein n=1 Tax=Thalassotalea litorea TaxID=2020715 RepID=A0A5R9IRV3_9GAMM|nr:penicillin acylase family protein [Thalassotalea litorea]TLU67203.1 penicillin acylase family protein [Thalassotalea litorea]